jgi:DNA-directed RNA polymerase II subunit RPB1
MICNKPIFSSNTKTIKELRFTVLGNKEILNLSALDKNTVGITTSELHENDEPTENGLLDKKMGTTDWTSICATCDFHMNYCNGHFGHMKLANPTYHFGFYDNVISILNCICTKCSSLLWFKHEEDINEIVKNKKGKERLKTIKELVKNVSNCQVCNNPVAKVKANIDKKSATIGVIFEYKGNSEKKLLNEDKTSTEIYNILKNIRDTDSKILGLTCRPEDLLHTIFPVPPVPVRPSVRADWGVSSTKEDQLTGKLIAIHKANIKTIQYKDKENEINAKYTPDHINWLQYNITTYFNNDTLQLPQSEQRGVITSSLATRFKGKEGRIRGNLMGKRVNQSARTVITPDPILSINEVGIPLMIAKNLTFPEIVTPYNIDTLRKYVQNGHDVYPGANNVIQFKNGRYKEINLRNKMVDIELGDIVERHLLDGDIGLLNRQPTLWRLGTLAHYIKVYDIAGLNTIRINPNVCKGYAADFDGDEMNFFTAQSIQTQIELEYITDVKYHIISPKTSLPIVGVVYDGLIGIYNLTKYIENMDKYNVMNLLTNVNSNLNKKSSGNEIYSAIIPNNINVNSDNFKLKNGKIIQGFIDGSLINPVSDQNSLIQIIHEDHGAEITRKFIDNSTNIGINFNMYYGFTVTLMDYYVTKDIFLSNKQLFETKKMEILYEITDFENNPNIYEPDIFENKIKNKLDAQLTKIVGNYIISNLDDKNNALLMLKSKSKGKPSLICQMSGFVGQQDYEGKRMPKNYNNRCSPYFFQNDDSAKARGFIESSFVIGMSLSELIYQTTTSREALITQAVKTADTGYLQRKLIKSAEDFIVKYDGSVRNALDKIQQYVYGESGTNSCKVSSHKIKFLKMSDTEIKNNYKFTKDELKNIEFSNEDNEKYYMMMLNIRNKLRKIYIKSTLDHLTLNNEFVSPINLNRIIENYKNMSFNDKLVEPYYIIDKIEYILKNNVTRLIPMTEEEMLDKKSNKHKDDIITKTLFRYILLDELSPKNCIINYKFTTNQFDELVSKIIFEYNNTIIDIGEMVGILSAQCLSEPATQMTISKFHSAGSAGAGTSGVSRLREIYAVSVNIKEPLMHIYFEDKYKRNKTYVNKISAYIKHTIIKEIRNNITIIYDAITNVKNNEMMLKDNISDNIFNSGQNTKTSCTNKIDNLPFLIRIEFNKESLLSKEITLLDIKSQLCYEWDNRFRDTKNIKKDKKKKIFEKIIQMAILSNNDNDNIPIIHIRFSVLDYDSSVLIEFMNSYIDEFKIKGITGIDSIVNDKAQHIKTINYNKDNGVVEDFEYFIQTRGTNIQEIRNIQGIDLNKTFFNDINKIYETFGIEACRTMIIRELINTYRDNDININYSHFTIYGDLMTNLGSMTSLDRFGLNKLDNDPLSRASFEKPIDILLAAGLFGETDYMKSVSSRIIAGMCIKGGTNLVDVVLDKEQIENSEYIYNEEGQKYNKTFNEISGQGENELNEDVFIPSF